MPKKRKVVSKVISCKRYGEILFQKVAPGYLLHFAQDGSAKNALKTLFLREIHKHPTFYKKTINPPSKGPYLPLRRALLVHMRTLTYGPLGDLHGNPFAGQPLIRCYSMEHATQEISCVATREISSAATQNIFTDIL